MFLSYEAGVQCVYFTFKQVCKTNTLWEVTFKALCSQQVWTISFFLNTHNSLFAYLSWKPPPTAPTANAVTTKSEFKK